MKSDLNNLALATRNRFNEDALSPIDIFAAISRNHDVTMVFLPMPRGVSGLCVKDGSNQIIAVNSSTSLGRQRFTAAHELYHLQYGGDKFTTICELDGDRMSDSIEREADLFASCLLMPSHALYRYGEDENIPSWTPENCIKAESYFQISHMAFILRLREENYIDQTAYQQLADVKVREVAGALGLDLTLYLPSPENKQYYSTGKYIRKVNEAYRSQKISRGKYREWLLDGFRLDLLTEEYDRMETLDND